MEESVVVNKEEDLVDLPPGFRFHPTDEEIITHYLTPKVLNTSFSACAIGEVDLNKCEPWDLPMRAKMGEKEWYFFCQRDRKYPTGTRTNRATESGYWKATGKDREIYKGKGRLVGMKKTLVFYRGRAPKGEKTNWVMHEFRLEGKFYYNLPRASKDDWVVCRVFHKNTGLKKAPLVPGGGLARSNSYIDDDMLDYCSTSPPPLIDPTCSSGPTSSGFTDAIKDNEFKFKGMGNTINLSSSSSMPQSLDGNYFYFPPRSTELQDQMVYHNNNYSQMMSMMLMNPISSYQGSGSINPGLLHRGQMGGQNCKVEQFSSKHDYSMVSLSQDTSLSTDVNTTAEISSSKQENLGLTSNNNNIEDISDVACLWDF
ncbi:NAC domain-containing protein 87-like [Punica granatum]|uniref:NAC domain-containing protein 87-like n=2 Tax=Punica granatum TaxID=22663 RepID=A0A218WKY0_PUNGR|nr:NAC domain-containing protein 87-like [Punica granatum]OWM73243.1 hypothetical protein CDL15_Pgr001357 [Punica granatum]